jgi:hypothetical protein
MVMSCIWLEVLTKVLCQDSQWLGWDLHPERLEYEQECQPPDGYVRLASVQNSTHTLLEDIFLLLIYIRNTETCMETKHLQAAHIDLMELSL